MECYFDNSATTKPLPEAVDTMIDVLTNKYGNPSSLHFKGDEADEVLENARKTLAAELFCDSSEVYFTSGGTESNNIAIMGAAHARAKLGKKIVTSAVEHPSVLECMNRLSAEGFEVLKLPVNKNGKVEEESLFEAVDKDTILVSLMFVNNEVGSLQPIETAAKAVKISGAPALLHTDAVQAFGKIPLKVSALGVDLLTLSAHKIHGPKGAGAIFAKKGTKLSPYILGGGQENGLRSGTQGMPGIAGLSAAVSAIGNKSKNFEKVNGLRETLLNEISSLDNLTVNSTDEFPYILNLSLLGIPAEVLRNFLSEHGICVSTGSACSKGHRSHVLTAMGLSPAVIDSALRISFSRFNNADEVKYLANCLLKADKYLKKA